MPLQKNSTPEAFKKNVSTEIKSGIPRKQAIAIAYSIKRKAEAEEAKKKVKSK